MAFSPKARGLSRADAGQDTRFSTDAQFEWDLDGCAEACRRARSRATRRLAMPWPEPGNHSWSCSGLRRRRALAPLAAGDLGGGDHGLGAAFDAELLQDRRDMG